MLSNVKTSLLVQLIINGVHKTSILPTPDSKFTKINLSLQTHNKVIAACYAYRNTGVEIAIKIDEIWLKQECDCGQFCFEIDRKYDLNNEKALVLDIVIEDQA
ncbi:44817_t:CDS:2, partial [Gigaspora margarita]